MMRVAVLVQFAKGRMIVAEVDENQREQRLVGLVPKVRRSVAEKTVGLGFGVRKETYCRRLPGVLDCWRCFGSCRVSRRRYRLLTEACLHSALGIKGSMGVQFASCDMMTCCVSSYLVFQLRY